MEELIKDDALQIEQPKPEPVPFTKGKPSRAEPEEKEDAEPIPLLQSPHTTEGEYFKVSCPLYAIELQSQHLTLNHLSFIAGSWAREFNKALHIKKRRGYV